MKDIVGTTNRSIAAIYDERSAPRSYWAKLQNRALAARRIVAQAGGDPNDPNQMVPVATEKNVILEVQALRKSRFFRKMVQNGTWLIAGDVYDFATQRVNILIQ